MYQLIATFLTFLCIPVLLRFKLKLSHTIAITASILALVSGIGINRILRIMTGVFLDPLSLDTILTVFMVSLVGGAMKHYGLLNRVVSAILQVIRSRKTVLMVIPSLIGMLTIPGGAVLSAPFVDDLGKDVGLIPPQRAAVNLIFRHIAMLVFPFSMVVLFVRSSMPGINIYLIIFYNLVFMVLLLTFAYFRYLRKIQDPSEVKNNRSDQLSLYFKDLAVYTSPIYVPVVLNAALGIPFSAAMLFSLLTIFYLSDRKEFAWVLKKSAGWDTVLMIVSVLMIKDIILQMNSMLEVFDLVFNAAGSHLTLIGVFIATSVFFGFITGNMNAPLAITLPMLTRLSSSNGMSIGQLHVFTYFLMISAFLGYYFSPLHLCQTFTLKVMKVSTGELYKTYGAYVFVALGLLVVSTMTLLAFT